MSWATTNGYLFPFIFLCGLAWSVIAIVLALKGDMMDRSDRVAQLYGYSVCLVCVVVFLISVASLVDNAFKYSDPVHSNPYGDAMPNLSSFEAYKATYTQADTTTTSEKGTVIHKATPLSDSELLRRYGALRADLFAKARLEAERAIVGSVVLILVAVVLFALHWQWLRKRAVLASAP